MCNILDLPDELNDSLPSYVSEEAIKNDLELERKTTIATQKPKGFFLQIMNIVGIDLPTLAAKVRESIEVNRSSVSQKEVEEVKTRKVKGVMKAMFQLSKSPKSNLSGIQG